MSNPTGPNEPTPPSEAPDPIDAAVDGSAEAPAGSRQRIAPEVAGSEALTQPESSVSARSGGQVADATQVVSREDLQAARERAEAATAVAGTGSDASAEAAASGDPAVEAPQEPAPEEPAQHELAQPTQPPGYGQASQAPGQYGQASQAPGQYGQALGYGQASQAQAIPGYGQANQAQANPGYGHASQAPGQYGQTPGYGQAGQAQTNPGYDESGQVLAGAGYAQSVQAGQAYQQGQGQYAAVPGQGQPPAQYGPNAGYQGAPEHAVPVQAPGYGEPAQQPGAPAPVAEPMVESPARTKLAGVRAEVAKSVVGQEAAVTGLVIALLCRGHVLLEGVPGVAKTLLTRTLGAALDLEMKRVQFTPDLMPGDITGSLIYDARTAEFSFREGPVFTNLMLADEINRTPPKTQASLLEAMEERQVTVDGDPRPLPDPFVVIATQNPVEYEGTYPLPEAQLDRFLLKLILPLPGRGEEIEIINRHAHAFDPRDLKAAGVTEVADADDLEAAREEVAKVQVGPEVLAYIVDICRATRTSPSLSLGVSPRGATALLATSRAWAWLSGRTFVTPDDVKSLAHPTLRHRVQLRAEAELEGVSAETVLDGILGSVPVPR
ncbi:ATPase family associated with various cellular activities (AAA) [Occultella aeris]|uniref:ATPase family associated with various cellular activities (AAA) n=2 Tax=Occultella aeris TaxID=2761496 RepID=A0A7M4DL36_9MICO|nr:ATPase family associated with various cellular activities (AAA) [Occultella aeris]